MGIHAVPGVAERVVPRAGVRRVLDGDAALVVVRAPAGAGKTTAVAEWAQQRTDAGVWLTLDSTCDTRAGFWQAVTLLLRDAGSLPAGNPLVSVVGALGSVSDLRGLLLRGMAGLRHPVLLVIDDIDRRADAEILDDLVAVLASNHLVRVIVTTGVLGELESDSNRVRIDVDIVVPQTLALDVEETARLTGLLGVADPDGAVARAVQGATAGHALLTRVVLELTAKESLAPEEVAGRVATLGAGLLAGVFGDAADPAKRDFAARISVAEVLTPRLATALSGRADARELLEDAEARGFATRLPGPEPLYVIDDSVRLALRAELVQRFPAEVRSLVRIVAEWGFDHRRTLEALRHALSIDDIPLAARAVEGDFYGLIEHVDEVVRLLGSRQMIAYRNHPMLAMVLAFAYMHHDAKRNRLRAAEALLAALAFSRTPADKSSPMMRAVLTAAQCGMARGMGRADSGLPLARRAVGMLRDLGLSERDQMPDSIAHVAVHVGLSLYYGGATDEALVMLGGLASLSRDENMQGHFEGRALISAVYAVDGRVLQAREGAIRLRPPVWPRELLEGMLGAGYQAAEAVMALEAGDYTSAVQRSTTMLDRIPTLEHWPWHAWVRSLALIAEGRAAEGLDLLDADMRTGARMGLGRRMRELLSSTRALLLAADGRYSEAHRAVAGNAADSAVRAIAKARIHLLQSEPERALGCLQHFALEDQPPRQWVEILLLRAVCAHRMQRPDLRDDLTERALALCAEFGLRHPFALVSPSDRSALLAGMEDRADAAVLDAIRAMRWYWPEPLSVVALTPRERQVLRELALGRPVAQVASSLGISANTVKTQTRGLYRKLGVTSREQAVERAGALGLLDPEGVVR